MLRVLIAAYGLPYFILSTTPQIKYYFHLQFTDEDTEAEK